MTKTTSTIVGFFAAPLVIVVPLLVTTLFAQGAALDAFEATAILYFFYALQILVFGLPAFLLLKKYGLISWWSAMGTGATIGVIDSAAVVGTDGSWTDGLWVTVPAGALVTLTFWLIWRVGRDPDTRSIPGNG
jgi:hypothetical protein